MSIKPRIYIDTSCFIDYVAHKVGALTIADRNDDIQHVGKLLKAAEAGDMEILTSIINLDSLLQAVGVFCLERG